MANFLPLCFFLFITLVSATNPIRQTTFIVRVQHDAKPSLFPTYRHWYQSSLTAVSDQQLSSRIIHTYDTVFQGFSAQLSALQASKLESAYGVLAVIPEQVHHLHTTRSPEFLRLKTSDTSGLLKESDFGLDLVIRVLDTGIWPERGSFNDKGLGLVPEKWRGGCVVSSGFPASSCNRKLIGAKYFSDGYEATNGKMNETVEHRSPRDSDGHGTHTASIAAGRYIFPASTLSYAHGVAAGGLPRRL